MGHMLNTRIPQMSSKHEISMQDGRDLQFSQCEKLMEVYIDVLV